MESLSARIDLTTPVHYRILRQILTAKDPFLQTEIATATGAANSQVSRLVRWLEVHQHVLHRRSDGRYEAVQPAGLILAVLPYQRRMVQALEGTKRVRGRMDEVSRILTQEGATLCLESALSTHSEYFRADRVAVYHAKPRELLAAMAPDEGGLLPVAVYSPDIPLEGDVLEPDAVSPLRRTDAFRTLIDLVCDNRAYAAKDLFSKLWGIELH